MGEMTRAAEAERVAVKREHVIEDAKTLAHLMAAIKEESRLLASPSNTTTSPQPEPQPQPPAGAGGGGEYHAWAPGGEGAWYNEGKYGPAYPPPLLTKAKREEDAGAGEEEEADELLAAQRRTDGYRKALAVAAPPSSFCSLVCVSSCLCCMSYRLVSCCLSRVSRCLAWRC